MNPNEIPAERRTTTAVPSAPPYDLLPITPPMWNDPSFVEPPISLARLRTLRSIQDVYPLYSYRGWDAKRWLEDMRTAKSELPAGTEVWKDPGICGLRMLVGRTTCSAIADGFIMQTTHESNRVVRKYIQVIRGNSLTTNAVRETKPIPKNISDNTHIYVDSVDGLNLVHNLYFSDGGSGNGTKRRKIAYLTASLIEPTGGRWIYGRLGIEEDLFYRTSMALGKCNEQKCNVLYTPNVTLFRNSESYGYSILETDKQAIFDAISFSTPNLSNASPNNSKLSNEAIMIMRRDLTLAFSAAIENGVDVLVLTPFGCDYRLCPPEAISGIIRAVAEQYAGYIQEVHVAISPDLFQSSVYNTFVHTLTEPNKSATLRLMRIGQPGVSVFKKCCPKYDACRESVDTNPSHFETLYHPPECPNGVDCTLSYPCHFLLFMHPEHAHKPHARNDNSQNSQAANDALPFCSNPFMCPYVCKPQKKLSPADNSHIMQYRHFCQYGPLCKYINDPVHARCYSHIMTNELCEEGFSCRKINDVSHRLKFLHNGAKCFPVKCSEGDKCRLLSDHKHRADFYHGDEPKGIKKCYSLKWLDKHKINYT